MSQLTGPTLTACGACACLIANDDNSGDAFARDPEWRRTALSLALSRHGACWPVIASGEEDTPDACSFCGDDTGQGYEVATMTAEEDPDAPCTTHGVSQCDTCAYGLPFFG